MSEFQKGLLLGIMIMSSMFLFTASTKSEVDSKEKIVDYHLVIGESTVDMNTTVNKFIGDEVYGEGWRPFGSPVYLGENNHFKYGQAVVKYENDKMRFLYDS